MASIHGSALTAEKEPSTGHFSRITHKFDREVDWPRY